MGGCWVALSSWIATEGLVVAVTIGASVGSGLGSCFVGVFVPSSGPASSKGFNGAPSVLRDNGGATLDGSPTGIGSVVSALLIDGLAPLAGGVLVLVSVEVISCRSVVEVAVRLYIHVARCL